MNSICPMRQTRQIQRYGNQNLANPTENGGPTRNFCLHLIFLWSIEALFEKKQFIIRG